MKNKHLVVYYTTDNKSPVEDFINSLEKHARSKIIRLLKNAQEFGVIAIQKHIKKLAGTNLWEMRVLGKQSVRLIYFYQQQNIIFIIHGFIKKNQKTPLKEIKTAIKRYSQLVQ